MLSDEYSVLLIDDDADVLGALRIQKAYQMLNKTDIAIIGTTLPTMPQRFSAESAVVIEVITAFIPVAAGSPITASPFLPRIFISYQKQENKLAFEYHI